MEPFQAVAHNSGCDLTNTCAHTCVMRFLLEGLVRVKLGYFGDGENKLEVGKEAFDGFWSSEVRASCHAWIGQGMNWTRGVEGEGDGY